MSRNIGSSRKSFYKSTSNHNYVPALSTSNSVGLDKSQSTDVVKFERLEKSQEIREKHHREHKALMPPLHPAASPTLKTTKQLATVGGVHFIEKNGSDPGEEKGNDL